MNRRELHQTDKNPALSLRKQPTERRGFFSVAGSSPKGSGSVRESSVVLSKATFAARFLRQVAELAEGPAEFPGMTVRDQLKIDFG